MMLRQTRFAGAVLLALCTMGNITQASAESLYGEQTYRPLIADNKAFRVGDVITVQVYENSSATTSTDTTSQRKNNLNVGVNTLPTGRQFGGSVAVSGDFDGGGTTQRANKLLATLTVSVREVLPSGDLKVGGEQLLTVNDEQHKVTVEGRVRPQDISDGNVVLSTRLAEAHINYVGDGELSDRQRRAWWRKLLDLLGL
ncbi:flagellar basal body L-ring protein FlgH [Cupriavidus sp. 8B]